MAEDNKKMKLEVEFDRDEVAGTFMLMGEKLTDERWEKLTKETIPMDFNKFGNDKTQVQIAVIALAVASSKDFE